MYIYIYIYIIFGYIYNQKFPLKCYSLFKAVYFIGAPYCSIVTFALLSIEKCYGKTLPVE